VHQPNDLDFPTLHVDTRNSSSETGTWAKKIDLEKAFLPVEMHGEEGASRKTVSRVFFCRGERKVPVRSLREGALLG